MAEAVQTGRIIRSHSIHDQVNRRPRCGSIRAEYIEGLLRGSPILGTEYHYLTTDGIGLVRVAGTIKPTVAKKIEAAVAAL